MSSKKFPQPSRKGKKAWRKNVDLKDVEDALEEQREEERLFGGALSEKPNSALFQIDTEGDENLRSILPKPKPVQLTSLKILSERSAVPAVFSRTSNSSNRKHLVSREERERLLRITKKPKKGPFGAIVEQNDSWSASGGLSAAVKSSGHYDPWAASLPSGSEAIPFSHSNLPPSHPPSSTSQISTNPRTLVSLPAVPLPHAGTSYNPPLEAHTELLRDAHNQEEARLRGEVRWNDVGQAVKDIVITEPSIGAEGMTVDIPGDNEEEGRKEEDTVPPLKRMPTRKTKVERRKAMKALAEKRLLAEKAAKRRQLSFLNSLNAKQSRRGVRPDPKDILENRKRLLQEKLKSGMMGEKLGKHRVPKTLLDVQLGEDLSESLRGMKVEGNLFKDRFLNLQQRAMVEPRLRVLHKRRRARMVEYEKHAWKKFDRAK